MSRKNIVRLAVTLMLLCGLFAALPGKPTAAQTRSKANYVAGELLIQYRSNTTDTQKNTVRGKALGHKIATLRAAQKGHGDLELLAIQGDVSATIKQLANDPAVEFAEPNWIYTTDATPSDSYFTNGSLWGMYGASTSPSNQYQ